MEFGGFAIKKILVHHWLHARGLCLVQYDVQNCTKVVWCLEEGYQKLNKSLYSKYCLELLHSNVENSKYFSETQKETTIEEDLTQRTRINK